MNDLEQYPVFSIVRFDLLVKEFEREFNTYFDAHIVELARREGFCRSWRTRELRRFGFGALEQEFSQVYQIDGPERFRNSPSRLPPPSEKEPWRRDLSGWGRVFYRLLLRKEKDDRRGRCWARYEIDFQGAAGQQAEFRREFGAYVMRVLDLTGVHRAWQLEYLPGELQVDKDPAARHLAIFEVDAPENLYDPSLEADRLPWPGTAAGAAAPLVGRHYAELLYAATDLR